MNAILTLDELELIGTDESEWELERSSPFACPTGTLDLKRLPALAKLAGTPWHESAATWFGLLKVLLSTTTGEPPKNAAKVVVDAAKSLRKVLNWLQKQAKRTFDVRARSAALHGASFAIAAHALRLVIPGPPAGWSSQERSIYIRIAGDLRQALKREKDLVSIPGLEEVSDKTAAVRLVFAGLVELLYCREGGTNLDLMRHLAQSVEWPAT